MSALTDSIERALGDAAEDYDIDAIADALRPLGAESVDDFPSEEFWSTVAAHALPAAPQEPAPLDRFKAELTAAFWTEAGDPALWRRGGVTLEVVGASRVNFDMPQMFTTYRITVAGTDEVTVLRPHEVASWPALWAAVSARLDGWTSSVAARRAEYAQAVAAERAARAAAHRAVEAAAYAAKVLAALSPDDAPLLRGTMSKQQVADYLGIEPGSVRKQMSLWGIAAEYGRGPSGQPEARYPAAEVEARAARRRGRGNRTAPA